MASEPQLPVLPHGSPTILSGLSETFSFHSSPEAFITSRVLAFRESHPNLADSRIPVRAKVLNRNVAVISSYDQIKQVLCRSDVMSSFGASQAYDELMAPFFPPTNLLLSDAPSHGPLKENWTAKMRSLPESSRTLIQPIVQSHFRDIESGTTINLYESMKTLSWKMILGIFLSSSNKHDVTPNEFAEIESLQETLLRGQFSLFPVSVNTRFWRSPRANGLEAKQRLETLLKARVADGATGCPFGTKAETEKDDVARHLLLFTSSLAVKALASILTAFVLNIYIFPTRGKDSDSSLADRLLLMDNDDDRHALLYSILLETERLSPPVVGIMRRSLNEVVLKSGQEGTSDTLIPKSWDVWLYFVGAARDPAMFGSTANTFVPERYYNSTSNEDGTKHGFAFGDGPKACLGACLMREIAMTVGKTYIGTNPGPTMRLDIQAHAEDIPRGVQGWLGWQADVRPEEWARDMKQLPTQRPTKAVNVKIVQKNRLDL